MGQNSCNMQNQCNSSWEIPGIISKQVNTDFQVIGDLTKYIFQDPVSRKKTQLIETKMDLGIGINLKPHIWINSYKDELSGVTRFIDTLRINKQFTYVIIGFSVLLLIMGMLRRDNYHKGILHAINVSLFIINCFAIVLYSWALGENAFWFCFPSEVGWGYMILHFLIFLWVIFNQIYRFMQTLDDTIHNSNAEIDFSMGLLAWPVFLIAAMVCGFYFKAYMSYVLILFGITQLIQIFYFFKVCAKNKSWKNGFICSLVYLVGALATTWLLYYLIYIIIIVTVGSIVFLLYGLFCSIGAIGSSDSSSENEGSSYSPDTEPEYETRITDENGGIRTLTDQGRGNYRDDLGDEWEEDFNGNVRRRE